jgi:hypothetical protein
VRVALAGVTGAQLADLATRALAATDAETVRSMAREVSVERISGRELLPR